MDYEINKSKYLALIGHVQSGKTFEEISYCCDSVYIHKLPVIFIVRNITADLLQMYSRITQFNNNSVRKLDAKFNLSIEEAVLLMESKGVLLTLCNAPKLKKIKQLLMEYQGEYNLCIDEVDFSIKSKDRTSSIDKYLHDIKMGANHILGATATPFSLFSCEKNLSKIKKIKGRKNYNGIESLKINFVKPVINQELFPECDSGSMNTIYNRLLQKDRCVLLHTVTKTKGLHVLLAEYINVLFPDFTTVVYNGDGILVNCKNKNDLTKKVSVNTFGQIINRYHNLQNGKHLFINYSISEVLQLLLSETHISIISGHLASRGISFVSSDYSLHLTDQYFHPGKNSHGENLLQSLRILGCYSGSPELTLWCSKQTWKDILEQNEILDKLINSCDNSKEWFAKIQKINISKPKKQLTRHKLSKGIKWNRAGLEIEYQEFSESE